MKRFLVAAALVGALAPAAGAQVLGSTNFGTLCGVLTEGGQVCASGSAELYAGMLKVSIQNVQGPAGDLVSNGTMHRIVGFGLYYSGASMGPMGVLGAPVPGGNWANGVSNDLQNPGPMGSGWSWLLGASVSGPGGTWGCDDPTGNSADVSSCSGPLVFTFTNVDEQLVDMDRLNFAYRTQSIPGDPGSYKCYATDPAESAHSCLPLTTTPEPGTVVLLATGVLGLGGFGLVRRRRERKG